MATTATETATRAQWKRVPRDLAMLDEEKIMNNSVK